MAGTPPGPRLPRFAQGMRMLATEHRMLERYRRRYGDVFTLNVWPFDHLVVVADPAEVKRIFTGDPAQLHAGEGNRVLEPLVGPHSVLLLDEQEHLRRRKLLLPPFHGKRMQVYGELMREIADAELDTWPTGTPFPVHPSMQRITLRVIMQAVFGMAGERGRELEERIVELLDLGQRVMMIPSLQHEFGGYGPWARTGRAAEAVDAMIFEEIARRRAGEGVGDDILSLLLEARFDDGSALSDAELRDELVTLLVAGHETTATAMSWTVERVLRHPRVLARLREELRPQRPGSDFSLTPESQYLDWTVKETMRVRPVLTYVMRQLTCPLEVGGYTVPEGWTLGTSITLLHRRADVWGDPHAFRPERWADRGADTYTWVPFGGGVRRCLGAAFAQYEMRQVLGRVFSRCELRAADPRPERRRRRVITFVPRKGARVILDARRPARDAAAPAEARELAAA